ncbi:MAG: hypothetical protein BWY31_00089 [Lentisphaerae bacterium ADurb.Bin242]|nr:MAG: hypothetical protein BWY31_00089 [Lentisphaerae bacterium ADurb.Bin242]
MIRLVYIVFLTVLCVFAELVLRSFGLLFPFAAFFVFYAATAFGPRPAFAAAILAACGLDFAGGCGASHPWSFLALSAVIGLSFFWLHQVESESILLHSVPGAAIPFLVWLISLVFLSEHRFSAFADQLPGVILASFLASILLPVMIYALDTLNEKLGLDLYTDAKIKLKLQ